MNDADTGTAQDIKKQKTKLHLIDSSGTKSKIRK